MERASIERLTAHATPNRMPIEGDGRREQMNWVVRSVEDIPIGFQPEEASRSLSAAAEAVVADARTARGLPAHLDSGRPTVRLVLVDEHHLIVTVATLRQAEDQAHEYLVAASAALSALDKRLAIDDIQGIPRRFWRLLVGESL